ncbi:UDP-glucose 4-epimerase family protein [Sulfuricaulis limicola]|uniref:UDP-glucose 4-epimerase family protein n=1 Tax=Sulfuricaulis limicola TaxID=1620215 RepID=UPI0018D588DA|nr:SDR family oxidoreductase [Sulfuricaulis limicola]
MSGMQQMPHATSQDARVLVTGATGFVGRALCQALHRCGYQVRAGLRSAATGADGYCRDRVVVGDLGPETDWRPAIDGVDAIVHLAARVHVLKERSRNPLAEFRLVNVAATERLARMAAASGVRRLVYVSSVKVNGEQTLESPFTETDAPKPHDAYGMSKYEAEQALLKIAEEKNLEVVIVRPPLVYGSGVGGNFLRMMNWINRGFPLPLGSVPNSRSLIYLGNLVDALLTCVMHPRATGKIYLVSDGEDVSTPELVRRLAQAMGRHPRLIPFPPALLRIAGLITGNSAEVERLVGSLRVDSSRIRRELQWTPPFSVTQGLHDTAAWYSGRV